MDEKHVKRLRRHIRVRKKVSGSEGKPRLNVYRSLNHIYAQVIDDTSARTLVAASSVEKELRGSVRGGNIEGARVVGKLVAERAKQAGIEAVQFDRGGFKYHGRIKGLADAAREAGLKF